MAEEFEVMKYFGPFFVEKKKKRDKRRVRNGVVYALSAKILCRKKFFFFFPKDCTEASRTKLEIIIIFLY